MIINFFVVEKKEEVKVKKSKEIEYFCSSFLTFYPHGTRIFP